MAKILKIIYYQILLGSLTLSLLLFLCLSGVGLMYLTGVIVFDVLVLSEAWAILGCFILWLLWCIYWPVVKKPFNIIISILDKIENKLEQLKNNWHEDDYV
ncbi:MAG: hypothetical protein CMI58_04370 [Parcubacteria group bacterium]|nr:hypothetical protein [Parcubacteria group bacterium]|tara:strand:+ start:5884 stop:6186 length:303 start_codon:yes stop_codon:yes gene_type:complete